MSQLPQWKERLEHSLQMMGSRAFDLSTVYATDGKPIILTNLPFAGFLSPPSNPSQIILTTYLARGPLKHLANSPNVKVVWKVNSQERYTMRAQVGVILAPNLTASHGSHAEKLKGDKARRTFSALEDVQPNFWENARQRIHGEASGQKPPLDRFMLVVLEPFHVEWKGPSQTIASSRDLNDTSSAVSRWTETAKDRKLPSSTLAGPSISAPPARSLHHDPTPSLSMASARTPPLTPPHGFRQDIKNSKPFTRPQDMEVIDVESDDDNLPIPSGSRPGPSVSRVSLKPTTVPPLPRKVQSAPVRHATPRTAAEAARPETISRMLFSGYSSSASTADSDVEMEDEEVLASPPSPPVTPVLRAGRMHPRTEVPRRRRRSPSTSSSDSPSPEASGPGSIRRNRRRSHSPPQTSKMAPIASSSVSIPHAQAPTLPPTPPASSPEPPSSVSGALWDILDETPVPPFAIEDDPDVVAIIKRHKLAFGVYYELARGVSCNAWTWAKVKEALEMKREVVVDPNTSRITDWYVDTGKSYGQKRTIQVPGHELLKGTNTDIAWRVTEFMNGRHKRKSHPKLDIWRELDREAKAHAEGLGRELGLMGPYEGFQGNWYGGRVQVVFRVEKPKDQSEYKVIVEPLESRRSNYFSRALGSIRWAQLKIPDDYLLRDIEGIKKFTSQKFLFMGTTYIPFHAKDGNSIYLLDAAARIGDMSSFKAVCEWHNPIAMNFKQPIAKYSTRNTIGFSNSIPVLEFQDEDISFDLDDLTATVGLAPGEEPASHQLMTDGCGFINREALIRMKAVLPGLEFPPSAVQARIAGAKGVWVLHPTDTSDRPRIWIRPSQNKIKLPRPFDRAHRILNLLSTAHPMKPCSLSLQSILNLSHNGVSNEVLAAKLEEGLKEIVRPLMDWERPHAMLFLYDAISRIGSVGNARTARLAQASSRALGLTGRDRAVIEEEAARGDDQDLELDSLESSANVEYTGRNEHSGLPLGLHEAVVEAIQAGFCPQSSEFVYKKLHMLFKNCIDKATEDFRLPIAQSTTAVMIADPKSVLKENEVFFKPSSPLQNPRTGELLHQLEGDVLIGRYPLRLASDMQKVVAVNKLELQEYLDVLILPTVGARSMASILSGGDYDGDEDIIIWDQDIVRPFHNHPFVPEPPDFLAKNFEKQVQRVGEFCDQVSKMDVAAAQRRILDVMLLNVCDSKVGVYSKFHDTAVWKHGLNHEQAVLLAYMFTTVLDSPKTGLRVRPEVFKEHKVYDGKTPWNPDASHPLPKFLRNSDRDCAEPFILKYLLNVGEVLKNQLLSDFENIPKQLDNPWNLDAALLGPYNHARELADLSKAGGFLGIEEELNLIVKHVDYYRGDYSNAFDFEPRDFSKKGKGKAAIRIPKRLETFTKAYAENLPQTRFLDGPRVGASYAYSLGISFAFNVAFHTLCLIKAESQDIAPSTRAFDQARVTSSKHMRIAAEGGED